MLDIPLGTVKSAPAAGDGTAAQPMRMTSRRPSIIIPRTSCWRRLPRGALDLGQLDCGCHPFGRLRPGCARSGTGDGACWRHRAGCTAAGTRCPDGSFEALERRLDERRETSVAARREGRRSTTYRGLPGFPGQLSEQFLAMDCAEGAFAADPAARTERDARVSAEVQPRDQDDRAHAYRLRDDLRAVRKLRSRRRPFRAWRFRFRRRGGGSRYQDRLDGRLHPAWSAMQGDLKLNGVIGRLLQPVDPHVTAAPGRLLHEPAPADHPIHRHGAGVVRGHGDRLVHSATDRGHRVDRCLLDIRHRPGCLSGQPCPGPGWRGGRPTAGYGCAAGRDLVVPARRSSVAANLESPATIRATAT